MKLEIDKRVSIYPKGTPIYELTTLIMNNRILFDLIDNINVIEGMVEEVEVEIDISTIIGKAIDNIKVTKKINDENLKRFKYLWEEMSAEDKGIVLEQVVSRLGAYHYIHTDKYANGARVYTIENDSQKHVINKQNNFDIIFYMSKELKDIDKRKIEIQVCEGIEFHEAKKNVNNEIPADENGKIKRSMKNKLELMQEIYRHYPDGKYYIPTFSTFIHNSQKYLKAKGYEFVEIISVKQLYERYS